MGEAAEGTQLPTPGWYPDPAGRHHFRFWDGSRWSESVSTGGVAGIDPGGAPDPPAPPARPESADQLVVTAQADGGFRVATAAGVDLAVAEPPKAGGELVLRTPEQAVAAAMKLGSRHVVVARDATGAEIGRFEPAPGGGLRILARGALAARLVSWPDGTLGLVDPDENPLARFRFVEGDGTTTVETAPGLSPALGNLAVLVPVALSLANRLPTRPTWA